MSLIRGPRTFGLLVSTFPRDLAKLIHVFFTSESQYAKDIIRAGNYEVAMSIIDESSYNIQAGYKSGNIDLIKHMLSHKMIDTEDALTGACSGGHYEFAKALIAQLPQDVNNTDTFGRGLTFASSNGHEALVTLMLEHGAESYESSLYYACRHGHLNIVLTMLKCGAIDYDYGLSGACRGGYRHAAMMMLAHDATDLNRGLSSASYRGQIEMARFMIERGASDFNAGLIWACYSNRPNMAELMIAKGANEFNRGLAVACNHCYPDICHLLIKSGATQCACNKPLAQH